MKADKIISGQVLINTQLAVKQNQDLQDKLTRSLANQNRLLKNIETNSAAIQANQQALLLLQNDLNEMKDVVNSLSINMKDLTTNFVNYQEAVEAAFTAIQGSLASINTNMEIMAKRWVNSTHG